MFFFLTRAIEGGGGEGRGGAGAGHFNMCAENIYS